MTFISEAFVLEDKAGEEEEVENDDVDDLFESLRNDKYKGISPSTIAVINMAKIRIMIAMNTLVVGVILERILKLDKHLSYCLIIVDMQYT